nr:spore germination protein [Paenibacillus cremeus]
MSGTAAATNELLSRTLQAFQDCSDLVHQQFPAQLIDVLYFDHLTDQEMLRSDVLEPFSRLQPSAIESLLTLSQYKPIFVTSNLVEGILHGEAAIFFNGQAYLYDTGGPEYRAIQSWETESVISGPHDAFTESLDTNLSLIRRRVRDARLKTIPLTIGKTRERIYASIYRRAS